ncbi:hypothetical protein SARC_04051 [Sphaeroforma arctica JP610]|uniref:mannitol 2-dehydrogenase n=1 Tax=Sphaeroforma arctica JP610 TaxID=667725 RepID=A0A0L0G4I3_9EUKA|nr:hypothetical protein SARC_04051 [Sphaeroforma arctica JP610]KNC83721.1 hypothetical protein SARC_04051 [Sphaeroforma arctica JP610]|eukprot:XP_014157623.1 hypothetical protein SARC_04051 [Sphaeroforma arctica JP610]
MMMATPPVPAASLPPAPVPYTNMTPSDPMPLSNNSLGKSREGPPPTPRRYSETKKSDSKKSGRPGPPRPPAPAVVAAEITKDKAAPSSPSVLTHQRKLSNVTPVKMNRSVDQHSMTDQQDDQHHESQPPLPRFVSHSDANQNIVGLDEVALSDSKNAAGIVTTQVKHQESAQGNHHVNGITVQSEGAITLLAGAVGIGTDEASESADEVRTDSAETTETRNRAADSRRNPAIVHIGLGNFVRAHFGRYMQDYNEKAKELGLQQWDIRAVDRDSPRTRDLIEYFDESNYTYDVTALSQEYQGTKTIGAFKELVNMGTSPEIAIEMLADENTKVCSLTVTEKGYSCDLGTGAIIMNPELEHDLTNEGSQKPKSMLGLVVEALRRRMERGHQPLSMMSLDNIPGNGFVFQNAVVGFARLKGCLRLEEWIRTKVYFPNTMVDRITPNTKLASDAVICEPFRQWVVETRFCNDRPQWELLKTKGVNKIILTDDVIPYEHLKVRILNATHSMFAYCAYLCGYRQIDKAMADTRLLYMVQSATRETLTTVHPPEGVDTTEYADLIVERFGNPRVSDAVARVCEDGSMKANSFWKPIIQDHVFADRRFPIMAIGIATWIFYSSGEDGHGHAIEIRDPMMGETLKPIAKQARKDKNVRPFLCQAFGEEIGDNEFVAQQVEYWYGRIVGEGSVDEFLTSMEKELKEVAQADEVPAEVAEITEPISARPPELRRRFSEHIDSLDMAAELSLDFSEMRADSEDEEMELVSAH